MPRLAVFVFGFLAGALFCELISPPEAPRHRKLSYTAPVMTDFDKADLDFFKAMRSMSNETR